MENININFHAPISTDVIRPLPELVLKLGGKVPSYKEGYTIKKAIEEAVIWIANPDNKELLIQHQKNLAKRGIIDYNSGKIYLSFNHTGGYSYKFTPENKVLVYPCLRGETFTAISW